MKRTVTIKDVARESGISLAQVSRVINNHPSVNPDAFLLVRRVIERLGYVPDTRGRGTPEPTRWSGNIMLLTFDPNPVPSSGWRSTGVYMRLTVSIEQALAQHDANLVLRNVRNEEELLRPGFFDGIGGVIALGLPDGVRMRQALCAVPCVGVMGTVYDKELFDWVSYDNAEVGWRAAEFLLAQGCRRCGLLTYETSGGIFFEREQTFLHRLAKAGITGMVCRLREREEKGWDYPIAYLRCLDGLFCTADVIMHYLSECARRVGWLPGPDFHLVSSNFDWDWQEEVRPYPAAVDIHPERVGERAVRQLFWRRENPFAQRERILVPVELLTPEQSRRRLQELLAANRTAPVAQ